MKTSLGPIVPVILAAVGWHAATVGTQGAPADLVFDNLSAPATFGYSSPDLDSYYGALLSVTHTGTLGEVGFSLYNHGNSGGNIVAGIMRLAFYDATAGYSGGSPSGLPFLGSLNIPLDLSANPLAAGHYITYLSGNVSASGISLANTVLVTQQFEMTYGSSTRYGIAASSSNPAIGSAPGTYFLSNLQNVPGLFTASGGASAFPLYQITVVPEPETWGALAAVGLLGWAAWRKAGARRITS